ncbi:hypothetical protein [Caldivirga sp.]|uniref:hypothetical protein n=1 Tax=Caldivirga sp. TaxID=2080243 RepID=UPI003D0DE24A
MFIEPRKLSTLKWLELVLLFIGLPTVLSVFLSFSIPYYLLHNVALANELSIIVSIAVFALSSYALRNYLRSRNALSPLVGRRSFMTMVSLDDEHPIDGELVKRIEDSLRFVDKDTDEYVKLLAMIGIMNLRNAVAYGDRNLYMKAKGYLSMAEEAAGRVNVGEETKLLMGKLRLKVEEYKKRFNTL